jgi:hypothetical protein
MYLLEDVDFLLELLLVDEVGQLFDGDDHVGLAVDGSVHGAVGTLAQQLLLGKHLVGVLPRPLHLVVHVHHLRHHATTTRNPHRPAGDIRVSDTRKGPKLGGGGVEARGAHPLDVERHGDSRHGRGGGAHFLLALLLLLLLLLDALLQLLELLALLLLLAALLAGRGRAAHVGRRERRRRGCSHDYRYILLIY